MKTYITPHCKSHTREGIRLLKEIGYVSDANVGELLYEIVQGNCHYRDIKELFELLYGDRLARDWPGVRMVFVYRSYTAWGLEVGLLDRTMFSRHQRIDTEDLITESGREGIYNEMTRTIQEMRR